MQDRSHFRYVIKVFEAQWDMLHNESVKPFFEQLKRDVDSLYEDQHPDKKDYPGHDALFSYSVFQNGSGLKDLLWMPDYGVDGRTKLAYFACHGEKGYISAATKITTKQLRRILSPLSSYDGIYVGACDFVDKQTAHYILNGSPYIKWIAGYEKWVPWLESTICDILFFRLLMSGRFVRPKVMSRWDTFDNPQDVAYNLYAHYSMAKDLRFSLYYRESDGIKSTLDEFIRVTGKR